MKTISPYYQTDKALLYQGDCLDILSQIDTSSVHMVLCDLPYGTTYCSWDSVIPLVPLWRHLERVIIGTGAMVFTASQPFTTQLIQSNIDQFSYCWYWKKRPVNFLNAKLQPLRNIEEIVVFNGIYNPLGLQKCRKVNKRSNSTETNNSHGLTNTSEFTNYPNQVIEIIDGTRGLHPTQKPVELMEYLIRTYTQEGETVLDMTCGSGTTLVAALQNKRKCVGIELDKEYCEVTRRRILRFEPFKISKSV